MGPADLAEARLRRTNRIAELVCHLTEIDPWDVHNVVEVTDTRLHFTHEAALTTAARALLVLRACAPRPVRTPGYLRPSALTRRTPAAHHTSLRRWRRTVPPQERAREFVRQELAVLRLELAERDLTTSSA